MDYLWIDCNKIDINTLQFIVDMMDIITQLFIKPSINAFTHGKDWIIPSVNGSFDQEWSTFEKFRVHCIQRMNSGYTDDKVRLQYKDRRVVVKNSHYLDGQVTD